MKKPWLKTKVSMRLSHSIIWYKWGIYRFNEINEMRDSQKKQWEIDKYKAGFWLNIHSNDLAKEMEKNFDHFYNCKW